MKNIFILGFMGSGKSFLCSALAKEWGRTLVDTDQEIERQEGKTVTQIFAQKGEAYFREKETQILRDLSPNAGAIVSTGGGMVMRIENTNLMQQKGVMVLLDTPFDMCFGRIISNKNRPLATDKSQYEMFELYLRRRMVYLMAADEVVDGVKDLPEKLQIMEQLKVSNRW